MSSHRGKNIQVYLMDGVATGRIKCTLGNWTGIVYRIPRKDLDLCRERRDMTHSGVYFLFGVSEDTDERIVYVGKAGSRKNGEGIYRRINEHRSNPEKDYWNETIIFTTTSDTFGPTEISYLENRFTDMAKKAGRYMVKNANSPTAGNVTEEKESELEEYLDYAVIVMGVLGHRVFEPYTRPNIAQEVVPILTEYPLFHINNKNINATAQMTDEGFVVLAGSKIRPILTPKCPDHIRTTRLKYAESINDLWITTTDLLFTSPSAAAGFVRGASSNGRILWLDQLGRTFETVEQESNKTHY